MLGLHGSILDIRVENIVDIIVTCLCVNGVDSSDAGSLYTISRELYMESLFLCLYFMGCR
jgi:hypothetical protein